VRKSTTEATKPSLVSSTSSGPLPLITGASVGSWLGLRLGGDLRFSRAGLVVVGAGGVGGGGGVEVPGGRCRSHTALAEGWFGSCSIANTSGSSSRQRSRGGRFAVRGTAAPRPVKGMAVSGL
jgi:hypothetical protein